MFPLKTSSHTGFHGMSHISMVFLWFSYMFLCFSMFSCVFPMVFRKSPPFVCYLPPQGFTPRRLVVSDANVTLVNVQAEALQEFIGRCMGQCICIYIYIYMCKVVPPKLCLLLYKHINYRYTTYKP